MTIYVSSTFNPNGATFATVVQNVDDMKLPKDGYSMIILSWCHQRQSVEILRVEHGTKCAVKPFCKRYMFPADRKPIKPAQSIELTKTANISTATV